jgi:methylmalonyl-CoA mutase N-terminal domain/subunit
LTDALEQGARDYIEKIDALGGALPAIEAGYLQSQIQNSAYQFQRAVERSQKVVVGVNRFRTGEGPGIPAFRIAPEIESQQVERLRALRASRDSEAVRARLDHLEQAARRDQNLMPFILDAAEACATVGEISDRLRNVFGEYKEVG